MINRLREAIGKKIVVSFYGNPLVGKLEGVSDDGVLTLRVKFREATASGHMVLHDNTWYVVAASIHAFAVQEEKLADDDA